MMHNFFLFIVLLLSSLLSLLLSSQFCSAEILKKIEITGNKRTTTSAIIQHGQIKLGQEFTDKEFQTIKENLGRIGQIHIKNIDFKEGLLKIEIEDKWTLFPVPMITQSGSYHNRGLVIYDDNFLGSLGTLAPGVSWSNSIFNYLLYYQDESLFDPKHGIKILLMKKSDYVEFKRGNKIIDVHESRYNSYLITPNYLYEDQVFKAGPVYIEKSIFKDNIKISQETSKGLFFRHHWNNYQALEVMYEGLVTTFDFYALKGHGKKIVFLNEANAYWSIPLKKSFFNFALHGYHSNKRDYIFAKSLGGEEGHRGYDKSSLPVSQNIGSFIQYQQHLFHRFFLSPFYEYNSSKLIDPIQNTARLNENTTGVGIRYYFKKISIPAVIFDVGRNIEDRSTHYHLNIGVSI